MFRAVRCTTALLAVLAASACGSAPTAPTPARKAPDAVPVSKTSADCNTETGEGCECPPYGESQPWWC